MFKTNFSGHNKIWGSHKIGAKLGPAHILTICIKTATFKSKSALQLTVQILF